MKILVTGAAGFIGYHVVKRLLERGDEVVAVDSINDYYDPDLKRSRLQNLLESSQRLKNGRYEFVKLNIADSAAIKDLFARTKIDHIIHLAAQAGVRYSLENPQAYVESNLVGFTNILEASRYGNVAHLSYASTSSVYGANTNIPYSEHRPADHPLQFYAATKRANELMAHSYSHLFGLPTSGLRFFTVYGPWGRPDMALFLFTKNILAGKPIKLFNNGNHTRDFTFVDDIVEGLIRTSDRPPIPNAEWRSDDPDPATSNAPWRIFNIGNSKPVELIRYVEALEGALGKKAIVELLPLQPGDVPDTYADTNELRNKIGYSPRTSIEDGIIRFVEWYREYYN
ncbi:NAD-dependent epimerase [Mesorhizobium muleiense]|uniref:NAD-dependent epimerase n=1 Tax=Mesorhizobium muleiense TaxID=1004279 RepID=UPI001F43F80E|nr:NAD-dependent epimerase [Mesorhizobium muleiense]MCF6109018.1 NAD-dependent epimerase [Mesorhizobium muleiense]